MILSTFFRKLSLFKPYFLAVALMLGNHLISPLSLSASDKFSFSPLSSETPQVDLEELSLKELQLRVAHLLALEIQLENALESYEAGTLATERGIGPFVVQYPAALVTALSVLILRAEEPVPVVDVEGTVHKLKSAGGDSSKIREIVEKILKPGKYDPAWELKKFHRRRAWVRNFWFPIGLSFLIGPTLLAIISNRGDYVLGWDVPSGQSVDSFIEELLQNTRAELELTNQQILKIQSQ